MWTIGDAGTTLAHAMTPDELPSPQRKASWKRWTLASACVLVIIAVALFLKGQIGRASCSEFVCSTNVNGVKTLVLQGTNGTAGKVAFDAWFTTNLKVSYRLK